jgi:phosphatidylinositol alpha-mannosyltransferase
MEVLVDAVDRLVADRPGLQLLVAGRGEQGEFRANLPAALRERVQLLGQVSESDKARMLRSVDVYCAPNTGQESFGVILLEAMAARVPVAASDLEAFRQVLGNGSAGALFPTGDAGELAATLDRLLDDPAERAALVAAGELAVMPFDWAVVVHAVVRVYELAIAGAGILPD